MIRRTIGKDLVLVYTSLYPRQNREKRKYTHDALLGIGGNIGDSIRRFEHLYFFLVRSSLLSVVETSPVLKNPPFGHMDQDDFYNALIHVKTDLTAMNLLMYVLSIEKKFGRKRSFANAPRTLDIDIIFYDDIITDKKSLTLPHPQWAERESVYIPMGKMKGKTWSKRHL